MLRATIILCAALWLLPAAAPAQGSYFGRNKVKYTDFDWRVLRTEHFDIYYDSAMAGLAGRGAAFAEESYRVLVEKFNHTVATRIPLVFYSSHLHFQQTNITPGFIPEGVGGFFEFLKRRVVIPYTGSMWDFRHVIRHELVHVFTHSKVNRVLADHRIRVDRLPPLWFIEGLAEYWSIDRDVQAEMVLRDATVSGYLVPLASMDRIYGTYLMYKEGQAVLDFVGKTYGEEKVLLLIENFWKHGTFEEVFRMTTGRDYDEFDREWTYALRKKYYPLLATSDLPASVTAPVTSEGFNSKPVVHVRDGRPEAYFIGNRTGYAGIYRVPLADTGFRAPEAELVVQGEKTDDLEAFHLFQGKIDVSADGRLAFVTKSGGSDAIHVYDLERGEEAARWQFRDLVVIGSVSWSPDGRRLAFSAVDRAGNNDLYVWDASYGRLARITNDIFDDRDPAWSPDGAAIVFSSDRGPEGERGSYNLFLADPEGGGVRFLTRGRESYAAAAWSPDGKALLFTSDLGGARNVWMLKMDGTKPAGPMKRITSVATGSFDPAWTPGGGFLYVAFEGFSFQIRQGGDAYAIYDTASVSRDPAPAGPATRWDAAPIAGTEESERVRYKKEYGLDFAQSEFVTDPVFGTYAGAYLSLSDLLGDEQYYFLVSNNAQSPEEILSSFNLSISRVSLERRAAYAYGIFRFSGRRYDLTDPDEYYFEKVFGGYLTVSYPLSVFRRVEVHTSVSSSDKDASEGLVFYPSESFDLSRRALFLSNSVSYVHDNSIWGPTGPLDGRRYSFTLAYTTDVRTSNANYFSVIADYRNYFRLGQRSALASRFWLFYNDGKEARRFYMGGSWDLRGYPRWSIRGEKLWLMSHELRFPFLDRISLGFPFVNVAFSAIRGALFFDAGGAWDDTYRETLGSTGAGLRLNLANVFVLRFDMGKMLRRNFTRFEQGLFTQFFLGWDF